MLFSVDPESKFVNYIDDENIEKQGVTVRCKFTDTVGQIKDKIKDTLQISGEF